MAGPVVMGKRDIEKMHPPVPARTRVSSGPGFLHTHETTKNPVSEAVVIAALVRKNSTKTQLSTQVAVLDGKHK